MCVCAVPLARLSSRSVLELALLEIIVAGDSLCRSRATLAARELLLLASLPAPCPEPTAEEDEEEGEDNGEISTSTPPASPSSSSSPPPGVSLRKGRGWTAVAAAC